MQSPGPGPERRFAPRNPESPPRAAPLYRGPVASSPAGKDYFAFSSTSTSRQRLLLLSGRVAMTFTLSPTRHSLFAS
jgi:hypothetical protein